MSVIAITITASSEQIISGIPVSVSISTSEPATIFYTTDGSTPTTFSTVYTTPIIFPKSFIIDKLSIVLSIFATNGIDSSAVIVNTYETDIVNSDARLMHAPTTNLNNASTTNSLFPFGTNSPNPNFQYLNPADAGATVYNPLIPSTPDGYDGNGNPSAFTNNPNVNNYLLQYSTQNVEGDTPKGVGNLPAKTTVIGLQTPVEYTQEESNRADRLFNPRALVIYQDSTTESDLDPVMIQRSDFSLENPEIVRDGNLLFNTGLDSPSTQGSFVNSHYNPRTNMMTYYYRDNTVNRWIISSSPFENNNPNLGALYQMVFPRSTAPVAGVGNGANYVYKWVPFLYRTLI